jgi:hypothetical protein
VRRLLCHLTLESCVNAKTSPPALRNPGLEWKASLNPITGLYLLALDRNSIGLLELEHLVLLAKRFRVVSCNYVCSEASHILLDCPGLLAYQERVKLGSCCKLGGPALPVPLPELLATQYPWMLMSAGI